MPAVFPIIPPMLLDLIADVYSGASPSAFDASGRLDHHGVLDRLHGLLAPRTYLEIGVARGASLALARSQTMSVGVDPDPHVPDELARRCRILDMTSDEFFISGQPERLFGRVPVDLAFIDGMHLFEFALRDFANVEHASKASSVVVLHDCLPRNERTAARERSTDYWTGDVWKLVLCLLDHRPDLELVLLDIPPSGLALVSGLRPGDETLCTSYADLVDEYVGAGFAYWEERWPDVVPHVFEPPLPTHATGEQERARRRLSRSYRDGRAHGRSRLPGREVTDADTVRLGASLVAHVVEENRGRHKDSGLRVMAVYRHPPQRTWWLTDLFATLTHLGIPCAWALLDDPALALKLEVFRPTVLLSHTQPDRTESPARAAIAAYKESRGCLRLLNPPRPGRDAEGRLDATGREQLRADMRREAADAHFLPFVRAYYADVWPEWEAMDFPYFEFLSGVEPRIHHPVDATRDLDYFIVSAPDPRRPATALEYLAPIMENYYGVWAGPGWEFGEGRLAPADTPAFYGRARIAPNPLHPHLVRRPGDITHRTFAAAACGAFVITDRTPITTRFFSDDELTTVTGPEEFREAFEYYVTRPEEREPVVRRGLRRVFAEHTLFHRVDSLVEFVRDHPELS